jgi:hypothetical protein
VHRVLALLAEVGHRSAHHGHGVADSLDTTAEDGELVDRVVDLQPEPGEQEEHHEQQHIVTEGRKTPSRQLRIEAHAALLPEAAAGEPGRSLRSRYA